MSRDPFSENFQKFSKIFPKRSKEVDTSKSFNFGFNFMFKIIVVDFTVLFSFNFRGKSQCSFFDHERGPPVTMILDLCINSLTCNPFVSPSSLIGVR